MCIGDLFAVVICKPWGVGASCKREMVPSQRLIVQSVSTAMNLGGSTEVLQGRADKAYEEGGMGGKYTVVILGSYLMYHSLQSYNAVRSR